ncbi:MAG: hypothetical protein ACYC96_06265 [Fimbriimonadaceae bacterium]
MLDKSNNESPKVTNDHPVNGAYRKAAKELYADSSGGVVEIDGCSAVTETGNGGAWVAAWVWVDTFHLPY